MSGYWRDKATPVIERVLDEHRGKPETEIRVALREAYPFGEMKYHPYKVWLDEIRKQMGKSSKKGHKSAQKKMREWEAIYGKRTA